MRPLPPGRTDTAHLFNRRIRFVSIRLPALCIGLVSQLRRTVSRARRAERCLPIAWQGGAVPLVVLRKADLADSPDAIRSDLESVAAGTAVIVTSSVSGEGLAAIVEQLQPARTGVLLGPSGAGKSTLINQIVGETVMRTREIHHSSGRGAAHDES